MTDRDRQINVLAELLENLDDLPFYTYKDEAEYLIDEYGVIVLPCKVGDKVYILKEKCKLSGEKNTPWNSCRHYWDNVFKNKMWGCAGKDKEGNYISCKKKEMVWYAEETEYSLLFYSNPTIVFEKNLFLTKEEAEQKLKELGK